jgi:F1F0 ATPase subunit 2
LNLFHLSVALFEGLLLGAGYFLSLWLTTQRLQSARHPWLLAILSFWARIGMAVTGLYFIMAGRPENLAAALAGFLLIRMLATRLVRRGEVSLPIRQE